MTYKDKKRKYNNTINRAKPMQNFTKNGYIA